MICNAKTYPVHVILFSIRKTFPCNEYPLIPHFYILNLGYAWGIPIFLFLLQNIDCGYSLEPVFRAKIKITKKSTENFQFLQHKKSLYIAWACFHNVFQKIDGCNKMTCMKCRAYFCWLCNETLSRANPYAHYNSSNTTCLNRLFEGVVVDRGEEEEWEEDFYEEDEEDDWWFNV